MLADKMQKNFIIYKSSAGSGKTFTLVKEYLKIVLNDKSKVRGVLAITFTNAAAAEMKSRIIETLGKLSKLNVAEKESWTPDVIDLMNHIVGNYDDNSLNKIISASAEVLSQILHNYGDFAVSTIDSFTHRIIRTFAFDLQIPMNFDIELDAKFLLNQAVELLISRVGTDTDGSLTKLMVAYMERTTDEEKKLSIEQGILKLASTLMKEDLDNNVELLKNVSLEDFFIIQKKIVAEINIFENEIIKIAKSVVNAIDEEGLEDESFFRGAQGISKYFRNLANGLIEEKIVPNSYVIKTIDEDKWFSSKSTIAEQAQISQISNLIKDSYYSIKNKAEADIENYYMLKLVNKNIFPLAVLNEVEKVLEEIKSQNSILHISDFNKKIASIVAEQPVPFIYERLGEKYQHYMIDEFQDTSLLQWQNLLPLVENALANGNMNLVVGDCKQAIYRWRGGEVEQFATLPELSEKIKSVSKKDWQKSLIEYHINKPLDTNYRSHKEIVDFNNSFFNYLHDNVLEGEYAKIYDESEQKFLPHKLGGYVHLEFAPSEEDEEGKALVENTVVRTLEIINDLNQNYNHNLSDITILCRSNHNANLLARFLLQNNISVISQESLLLDFSPDVNFFVSFLRLLSKPSDTVSFAEVVNYLTQAGFIADSNNIHQSFNKLDEFPLNKEMFSGKHIRKLEALLGKKDINISFDHLKNINLWDICEFIVKVFFSDLDGVNPFVAFFMDAVFEFTEKSPSSIEDFLHWWLENKKSHSVVIPKGIDAVQIMTIHKAKGLQFPVVIFPFVNMNVTKTGLDGFWNKLDLENIPELPTAYFNFTKEILNTNVAETFKDEKNKTLLDLLNIVYVAFTRPQQKLFILSNYPKDTKFTEGKNTIAFHLHNYLKHKNLWEDGLNIYPFGENEAVITKEDSKEKTESHSGFESVAMFDTYISNDWRKKICIRPSLKSPALNDEKQLALIRGRLMHKAMEKVYDIDDVEKVLSAMFVDGEITEIEKSIMSTNIIELLKSPELSQCFDKNLKIINEAAIMNENGQFFRPDRVVLSGKKAVVIDYKTGTPSESYKQQLQQYKSLLSQMGYNPVDAYLVYLDESLVQRV
jgi:ATP-dependent exoDNAse (exonuclease V) beta subunit